MKKVFTLFVIIAFSQIGFSQSNPKLDSLIKVLDNYTSSHIPDMNSGISSFKHKIKDKVLIRTTYLLDGKPYKTSFDVNKTEVEIEKLAVDEEAAKVYGFTHYYEVSIDGSWYMSNIEEEKIAKRIEGILNQIIAEVNTSK